MGKFPWPWQGFSARPVTFPKRLEELSPEYLTPIPRDVFVDRSLYFSRLRDGEVMVYSVGPNLNDDGGNSTRNLDLVLRMNLPSK
ncbi:MAG: hypothetical protein HC898_11005 [Phycisphaerales bacterium]|nr:hypothetical protein [Phycisphaerales bacterium]